MMSEQDLRAKAMKRAQDKVGFYTHFGIYLVVNLFLASIWLFTSGWNTFPWFVFVTASWGIGVAMHFIAVFFGEGLVERLTDRELSRIRRQHG